MGSDHGLSGCVLIFQLPDFYDQSPISNEYVSFEAAGNPVGFELPSFHSGDWAFLVFHNRIVWVNQVVISAVKSDDKSEVS